MKRDQLTSISPLDGRYADKTGELIDIFSEYGLIRFRVEIEVRWLQTLSKHNDIKELANFDETTNKQLNEIVSNFDINAARRVKEIESKTNHDVKAIEYFIGEQFKNNKSINDFLHFGCTSEDINNLAYAMMLNEARKNVITPFMHELQSKIKAFANNYATIPMLSRTHGQTASPTTVGKEFANVFARLNRLEKQFSVIDIYGKFNGAVGNFNAHHIAYPDCDWPKISSDFINSLQLKPNSLTTQIEPHDWMANYCHNLIRYNVVLIDLCRDIWGYISLGYFKQRLERDEVGSSTMPHKINPIDFENAEGNLGIANALLGHFAEKLPISRFQRDLTDSTVQRNLGVAIGHSIIAIKSLLKGINKLEIDETIISDDIENRWEVLAEAIQTVMRRYGIPEPYEKLKALTRGNDINESILADFIKLLDIPQDAKQELLELTPSKYTGLASKLIR
ncbi:MAG: adenylosuccinate lyase [Woeseiaceae bacterium]|nr:adenylosuccinate lyase [Woeseiaceae bacterium]MDG1865933.1 adenylosuccinate lyase [Woeseiaceae bacterium]